MENTTKTPQPSKYEGISRFRPPLCNELAGRRFELVMDDGYEYELNFVDDKKLSYGLLDGDKKEYAYECLKPEEMTYFVNFEATGAVPRTGYSFVLDMEQSLVTSVKGHLGLNPKLPKMPSVKIVFGAIRGEDGTIPTIRHGYTKDLCGKAIDWNYGSFNIAHVYSSERYYRVTFTPKAIKRIIAANPNTFAPRDNRENREEPVNVYEDIIDYVKIKDGVYFVNMVETILCRQRGHGNNLRFLMNLKAMHDVGCSFGTNDEGEDENYTFGAFGEYIDASDVISKPSTYYIR